MGGGGFRQAVGCRGVVFGGLSRSVGGLSRSVVCGLWLSAGCSVGVGFGGVGVGFGGVGVGFGGVVSHADCLP